jgi:hypothetical protein
MADEPTPARRSFGDIAPHLAEITDKVLFGDVWENSALLHTIEAWSGSHPSCRCTAPTSWRL